MAENCFYYDGSLCIACRGCQVACKQWNELPEEKTEFFAAPEGYQNPADLSPITWNLIKFHERTENGSLHWFFRRRHCSHCTEAACIEVCPVEPKAMTRHPLFGTVYVDQERCIGCGACQEACPFQVPHVDEELSKSRKCTGCYDRVENDLLPACATTCPTKAIRYGSKQEMYDLAKARVAELKKKGFKDANVYGITQLGGLHSICVLPTRIEVYGLEAKPKVADLIQIKREALLAYADWQSKQGLGGGLAGTSARTTAAAGLVGLATLGLRKLADRKARIARETDED